MYINHISDKMQFWIKGNVFTEDLVQSILKKAPGEIKHMISGWFTIPILLKKIEIKPPTCGIVSSKL